MLLPCRVAPTESIEKAPEIGLDLDRPNAQQVFGLGIVGLEIVIADRPWSAAMVVVGIKLVALKPDQRSTGPFRLAADVEVFLERNGPAVADAPDLFAGERRLTQDTIDVERAAVGRQLAALLEDQNAPPGLSQPPCDRGAAGPGADDDIVMAHVRRLPPGNAAGAMCLSVAWQAVQEGELARDLRPVFGSSSSRSRPRPACRRRRRACPGSMLEIKVAVDEPCHASCGREPCMLRITSRPCVVSSANGCAGGHARTGRLMTRSQERASSMPGTERGANVSLGARAIQLNAGVARPS